MATVPTRAATMFVPPLMRVGDLDHPANIALMKAKEKDKIKIMRVAKKAKLTMNNRSPFNCHGLGRGEEPGYELIEYTKDQTFKWRTCK